MPAPKYNTDSPYWYGLRHGSKTPKASGFLGLLPVPGTSDMATEYSVGVEMNGKETEVPTLVPTLTEQEKNTLLQLMTKNQPLPESILQKATEHAQMRGLLGQSPFWRMPEKQVPKNGLLSLYDPDIQGLFK